MRIARMLLATALRAPLIAAGLGLPACNDFDLAAPIMVTVTQAAPWPDSLAVTDSVTFRVTVSLGGEAIAGLEIDWESSDSSVLAIEPSDPAAGEPAVDLPLQLARTVTGHRTGTASITARVSHRGFASDSIRATVTVTPWTVEESGTSAWPTTVTVTDIDTFEIDIPNVDAGAAPELRVDWQSSDESVLSVQRVVPEENATNEAILAARRRAVVTARAAGSARVLVTVDRPGFEQGVFEQLVGVELPQLLQVGFWPDTLLVGDTAELQVELLDGNGMSLPDRGIQWVSGDPARLAVSRTGAFTATAVGVGRGPVPVSVTAFLEPPGFQRAELAGAVRILERWTAVSAGVEHTCGVTYSREVYCWGATPANGRPTDNVTPQRILGLGDVEIDSVSAGDELTCVVGVVPVAYCWGSGSRGRLGNNDPTESTQLLPVPVTGGTPFRGLAANATSCGPSDVSTVLCWGDNTWDQLGLDPNNPTTPPLDSCGDAGTVRCALRPNPISQTSVSAATYGVVSVGGRHVCAIESPVPNQAYCWGSASLGNATLATSKTAVPVSSTAAYRSISAGGAHTCAVSSNSAIDCWGANGAGQLGDGDTTDATIPTAVVGFAFEHVTTGAEHTCALTAAGEAFCWGRGTNGRLGRGSELGATVPQPVATALRFATISAGSAHTCALTLGGAVYCWGNGLRGRLGTGSSADQRLPARIAEPQ